METEEKSYTSISVLTFNGLELEFADEPTVLFGVAEVYQKLYGMEDLQGFQVFEYYLN